MTPPYSVLYMVLTPPYSVLYNVMTPPYSAFTNALQQYIGVMDTISQRHFDSDWVGSEVVVFPLTKRYTFWLACRLFINIDDPNHVAKFADPFGILAAGILSIPIDLPGTPFRRAIKASEFIRKELLAIIKQRKVDLGDGKASPTQDILSHMLVTSDENGNFMKEADIADKILGLLVGGHDTASSVCASIVMFLAELPHVYQRVPIFGHITNSHTLSDTVI
ncbi:hypothetical protein HYC85_017921 [Camellia sinensis]|uniref:Cytochrome P450 n=1 Tax=Camellia sinensis TaxID=4442 RepID=A0A7J7GWI2_CAMSI|nr:hypothetical protein HYC85_017921 [Camellia sinensis]